MPTSSCSHSLNTFQGYTYRNWTAYCHADHNYAKGYLSFCANDERVSPNFKHNEKYFHQIFQRRKDHTFNIQFICFSLIYNHIDEKPSGWFIHHQV